MLLKRRLQRLEQLHRGRAGIVTVFQWDGVMGFTSGGLHFYGTTPEGEKLLNKLPAGITVVRHNIPRPHLKGVQSDVEEANCQA